MLNGPAPAIELRGVVSVIGRFPALAGVDLTVWPEEIVLLRGPNGAGKTTLLRLCAGLLNVDQGEANVLGHDLREDRKPLRTRVGYLGHANGLYDDLTVEDNVRFWSALAGATDAEVSTALGELGLDGRLARTQVARLSAGQRRRTALAIMVARRPELWLLDEPHAALDAAGRDLLDRVIAMAASAGATVLIASHELDRAEAVAHRLITLVGGRVDDDRPAPVSPAVTKDPDRVP